MCLLSGAQVNEISPASSHVAAGSCLFCGGSVWFEIDFFFLPTGMTFVFSLCRIDLSDGISAV